SRKAVTRGAIRRRAERVARPDPLGPATSVVLRSRQEGASGAPTRLVVQASRLPPETAGGTPAPQRPMAPESIVFALADGIAYAVDATAGAPLWQVPLGLASPYLPQLVP